MSGYLYRQFSISTEMLGAITDYIEQGIEPGGFLTAVICNDLSEAVGRADDNNQPNLPAFVAYFYNEAPRNCWGSKETMQKWLRMHQEARTAEGR